MSHSKVQRIMNYNLNTILKDKSDEKGSKISTARAVRERVTSMREIWQLISSERSKFFASFLALIVNSVAMLATPYIIGRAIDQYVIGRNLHGLLISTLILIALGIVAFITSYLQIRLMGTVAQFTLFDLRNKIFKKVQELPLAFFSQNKAGDLINRINSDTEKLSQFFSETLVRFMGGIFSLAGAAIFLVVIDMKLGTATLLPAVVIMIISQLVAGPVKRANDAGLKATGLLSGEIQESIQNFKIIVATNRRDYFRKKFAVANDANYTANIKAGFMNGIFSPIYDFAANLGQFAVLAYGLYLVLAGSVTLGILVSFLAYAERFYNPLRQMAQLWASIQVALAAWSRVKVILSLESNMKVLENVGSAENGVDDTNDAVQNSGASDRGGAVKNTLMEFKNVSFHYSVEVEAVATNSFESKTENDTETENTIEKKSIVRDVLHDTSVTLEKGKTYALVGPTGGGKTTTASLMARLYDPTSGKIFFDGKDLRSYDENERARRIGFILQDPIVFAGTVKDNLIYGNDKFSSLTEKELEEKLQEKGLSALLGTFEKGIMTEVPRNADAMSLGQRQILAFIRAVLRQPDLLILDEATANIDTVTEKILEQILERLPKTTTKVIIAHRLNTIKNADTIFFVNSATLTHAGSIDHAMEMLLKGKKRS